MVTKHEMAKQLFNTRFQLSFSTVLKRDGQNSSRGLVIGRSSSSDMVLNYRTVSARHAEVQFKNGRFVFHDSGSSNGSYLYLRKPQVSERAESSDPFLFFVCCSSKIVICLLALVVNVQLYSNITHLSLSFSFYSFVLSFFLSSSPLQELKPGTTTQLRLGRSFLSFKVNQKWGLLRSIGSHRNSKSEIASTGYSNNSLLASESKSNGGDSGGGSDDWDDSNSEKKSEENSANEEKISSSALHDDPNSNINDKDNGNNHCDPKNRKGNETGMIGDGYQSSPYIEPHSVDHFEFIKSLSRPRSKPQSPSPTKSNDSPPASSHKLVPNELFVADNKLVSDPCIGDASDDVTSDRITEMSIRERANTTMTLTDNV